MISHFNRFTDNSNPIYQFMAYGFVGGLNFLLSTALYFFLVDIINLNFQWAFTIAWLFGIFFTYTINFLWVFKPTDKLEFKSRFPKYFMVYLTSYLVNIGLLSWLVENHGFDPFYIQFAILPLVVLINFFGFKYWSLK